MFDNFAHNCCEEFNDEMQIIEIYTRNYGQIEFVVENDRLNILCLPKSRLQNLFKLRRLLPDLHLPQSIIESNFIWLKISFASHKQNKKNGFV